MVENCAVLSPVRDLILLNPNTYLHPYLLEKFLLVSEK